tara:strand:+ start:503 stop:814 length:312 start_codon:yes stop_codon:yes gene_type:complete
MKLLIFLFLLLSISSCQAVKDGLTGKKRTNTDEFLIKKKNPLVQPPEFGDLPKPLDAEIQKQDDKINNIELLIKNEEILDDQEITNSNPSSVEKIILEKIKNR